MARIGGRNSWIAVPAGVLCAAILAALLWLSAPMVPVTVAWIGDTLRNATKAEPTATAERTPAQAAMDGEAVDCRTLYSDDLWNELTWRPGSLLGQSMAPAATTATAFADAAAADVLVTCTWRFDDGGIVTTLSKVGADAAAVAEASLAGDGFACTSAEGTLVCTRTQNDVREEQTLRDGLWVVSVETRWHPKDYGARLDRTVFG